MKMTVHLCKRALFPCLMAVLLMLTSCGGNGNSPDTTPQQTITQGIAHWIQSLFHHEPEPAPAPEPFDTPTPEPTSEPTPESTEPEAGGPGIDTVVFDPPEPIVFRLNIASYDLEITSATKGYDGQEVINLFDYDGDTTWRLPMHESAFLEWNFDTPKIFHQIDIAGNPECRPQKTSFFGRNTPDEDWVALGDTAAWPDKSGEFLSYWGLDDTNSYQYYRMEFAGTTGETDLEIADVVFYVE